ncbi:MAG: NAD-binding protein [Clostridiaceae bacterium]
MNFFKKQKKENIIIIGCGKFGAALATILSEQNKNVAVIDIDEKAFSKLSPYYEGLSIEGDGTDIDLLTFAGAKNADILVASTNDDDINITIAQIAKQVFGINKVITRIYDTSKQIAYNDMDIVSICPVILSVNEFERIALNKEGELL